VRPAELIGPPLRIPLVSTSSASAWARVAARPERVFPRLTQHDATRFYPRFGVLPAVVAVRDQTGGWDAAGQTRHVVMSDRSTFVETLRSASEPLFAYDLTDFTGLFGHLVAHARSEWRVTARGDASSIAWTYSFTAKPGWGLAVAAIVRFAWAPYMRRVLPAIAAWTATGSDR
jgi:hypothetical protein